MRDRAARRAWGPLGAAEHTQSEKIVSLAGGRTGGRTLLAVARVHRSIAFVGRQADLGEQQMVVLILRGVRAQEQLLLDVAMVVRAGATKRGRG